MAKKKQKRALLLYQVGRATQDTFDILSETGSKFENSFLIDQRVGRESSTNEKYIFTMKRTHIHKTTPRVPAWVNNTSLNMIVDSNTSVDIVDELAFNTLCKDSCISNYLLHSNKMHICQ